MTLTEPTRLTAGDLLAVVGEVGCAQAAQLYAALGYGVLPMHAAEPGGGCTCPHPACPDAGKHPRLRGWQRLATTDLAVVEKWWRRWPRPTSAWPPGDASTCLTWTASREWRR